MVFTHHHCRGMQDSRSREVLGHLMLVRGHLIGTTIRGRMHAEKALLADLVAPRSFPCSPTVACGFP
ncbi:hypothetical protein GCM10010361_14370 [Streptomyces olivaceiscleroticus]|uniref:Uncharacterized protein n=2 Tax=Streptomyces olivaceiscleroticus TaxID=68245 RepID=A0ABP3JF24_9ACTN